MSESSPTVPNIVGLKLKEALIAFEKAKIPVSAIIKTISPHWHDDIGDFQEQDNWRVIVQRKNDEGIVIVITPETGKVKMQSIQSAQSEANFSLDQTLK